MWNLGDFDGAISIEGVETASVTDSASVRDTSGDDVWEARDGDGAFQMEDAYLVTIEDVYVMHGYADGGGTDSAYMFGNSNAN